MGNAMAGFRLAAPVAVCAILAVGCGGAAKPSAVLSVASPSAPSTTSPVAVPTKCCVASASPDLIVTATPTLGPPGTVVHISGTGCLDASGQSHAVSYNNDAQNFNARNYPNTVRTIASTLKDGRISAVYKVVVSDNTGGEGAFFVQCGATVRSAKFKVTA